MLKKSFMIAVLMTFAAGTFVHAACTAEEAGQKGQAAGLALQQLMQKDQAKATELMTELATKAQDFAKNPTDYDAMCKYYDELTEKAK